MALDTYLVVFHHFDAHTLHELETKYIGAITTLTFIPALVFLFIHTPERGSIYGNEIVSISTSPLDEKILTGISCCRSGAQYPKTG